MVTFHIFAVLSRTEVINIIFADRDIEELYIAGTCSKAIYNKLCRDKSFYLSLVRVIETIRYSDNIEMLKGISYLHYEKLRYENFGKSSVRIKNGRVERLIFTENENGIEITLIELDTTHYGNKK